MRVRPSICLLAVLAAGAVAPLAFAQGTSVATDAGAPTASVTASATTAPPPAVTVAASAPKTTPPVAATATAKPAVSEQTVYQLGRLVELEAERARGRRYIGSSVELVGAASVITAGAIVFTLDTTGADPNLVTLMQVLGGVEIAFGGVMAIDAIVSLFVESPMERMFDAYAPVAVDKSLTPAERLRRGEGLLEAMASRERAARITGVAGGIIAAAIEAGVGVWLVADNDFWGNDPTTSFYRPVFGALIGLSVVSAVGDALAKALWERGPAELAWEHWRISHEPASVETSRLQIRPIFAPTLGGAMGGLRVRF